MFFYWRRNDEKDEKIDGSIPVCSCSAASLWFGWANRDEKQHPFKFIGIVDNPRREKR
jgi:hypothetical protein